MANFKPKISDIEITIKKYQINCGIPIVMLTL